MDLKTFVDNWLKPLCVGLVAIIGVYAAWIATQKSKAPDEAKTVVAQPDLSPFDLKVMNDVTEAIRNDDKAAYPRLTILVSTLYNADLATRLTKALAQAGDIQAAANLSAMAAFVSTNVDDGRAAIPAGTVTAALPGSAPKPQPAAIQKVNIGAVASRAVDATRTVTTASAYGGWNIDVFWCQGGDDAARQGRADAFAKQLAAGPFLAFTVGRVRVRPLPFLVNQRVGYQLHVDTIRAEASDSERTVALALQNVAVTVGHPLGLMTSTQPTPNYISAFYCA